MATGRLGAWSDPVGSWLVSAAMKQRRLIRHLVIATAVVPVASACSSGDLGVATTSLPASSTTAANTTTLLPTTTTVPRPTTTTSEATTTTEPAAVDVEPSAILGTWRGQDYYVTYRADGTWGVYVTPKSTASFDSGHYTFDGVVLTMSSRERGPCEGGTGEYEVTFSQSLEEMRVDAITPDGCPERQSDMIPSMSRYGS